MKKLNSKGFSLIEGLLILVLVSIIAGIGYYVWSKRNPSTSSNSSATITNFQQCKDAGNPIQESSPEKCIANGQTYTNTSKIKPSYTLPDGWSETNCDSEADKMVLVSPDDDSANNCDDRSNVVLISYNDAETNCLTEAEITEIKKFKPLSDYSCKEINIGTTKVINSRGNYGGGLTIDYVFVSDQPLNITYFADESNKLPNAKYVDELVQSVSF